MTTCSPSVTYVGVVEKVLDHSLGRLHLVWGTGDGAETVLRLAVILLELHLQTHNQSGLHHCGLGLGFILSVRKCCFVQYFVMFMCHFAKNLIFCKVQSLYSKHISTLFQFFIFTYICVNEIKYNLFQISLRSFQ